MSKETEDELKIAGMPRLAKLRHANQVRVLAMAKILQSGIDALRRRGELMDYRKPTPARRGKFF